jgi:hypothetical protein
MLAATVILTREYAGKFQIYLLNRIIKSGFMETNRDREYYMIGAIAGDIIGSVYAGSRHK